MQKKPSKIIKAIFDKDLLAVYKTIEERGDKTKIPNQAYILSKAIIQYLDDQT